MRLTKDEGDRLLVAAVRAELAEGAYAAGVVQRHLAAEFAPLPADWSAVMAELIAHRAAIAGLRGEMAAVGRLVNQLARHVNTEQALPVGETLTRLLARIDAVVQDAAAQLGAVDELTARARERL